MKTISELNSKGWYRLIKVIFILVFIIVLIGYNIFVFYNGVRHVDQKQTIIQCNLGAKTNFTAQSIGLDLSVDDFTNGQFDYEEFFKGYNSYKAEDIVSACYPKREANIYDSQKLGELLNKYGFIGNENSLSQEQKDILLPEYNEYKQQTSKIFGTDKAKYLDFSFKMFDIMPIFTFNYFLMYFFIGNVIITLIFEGLRRAFYYVVLGTIKPQ
ncbi:MAG: hypothetical protein WC460_04015 [Patescibacteria group bacterium]